MYNHENKDLMVFENPEFGKVRTVAIDGEPWLVGKDVAVALGYSNPRDALAAHVDEEDKATVAIHDGSQNRNMTVINESGVYSLIFSSKLPKAKEFKHWVTSEVLPSIRKTGTYSINQDSSFAETKQVLAALTDWMEQMEKKVSMVKREVSYSNYYLRLQMRSGYDENWEYRQSKNLKAVAEFIGKSERQILGEIYREMEHMYGITLDNFCKDYKKTKRVSTCSTLSVISFSLTLREMFDAVISEVMAICKIEPASTEGAYFTSLVDMATLATRGGTLTHRNRSTTLEFIHG